MKAESDRASRRDTAFALNRRDALGTLVSRAFSFTVPPLRAGAASAARNAAGKERR